MKQKILNSLVSAFVISSLCLGGTATTMFAESWAEVPETGYDEYTEEEYPDDGSYEEYGDEYYEDDSYEGESYDEVTDYYDDSEYLSDDASDDSYYEESNEEADYYEAEPSEEYAEEELTAAEEASYASEVTLTLIAGEEGYFYALDENGETVPDEETEKSFTGEAGSAFNADILVRANTVRKTFQGWTTGEEGSGIIDLSEYTYPGENQTLYAVYADAETCEDRKLVYKENAEAGTQEIGIGQNEIAILTFMPEKEGTYIFSSEQADGLGTAGYLYEKGILRAKDEDLQDGEQFRLAYDLKADTVYEIGIAYLSEESSGQATLSVSKEGEEESAAETVEAFEDAPEEELMEATEAAPEEEPQEALEDATEEETMEASEKASEDTVGNTPLMIITEPEDVAVDAAGDRATVTVEAEGDGLTYQWYYKNPGASKFLASSNQTAEYSVSVTERINGRQVYCVITDSNNESVTTRTVHLSIRKPLEIITQPVDAVVSAIGERATVSVEAEGSGLTYQWYYKNAGTWKFLASSTKTAEYSVAVTSKVDGRQVYCVVTDASGNTVTTDTVTIMVARPLSIITQPVDAEVDAIGDRATVTVEAEGSGITYQWFYKNAGSWKFLASSAKTAEYTVAVTEKVNGREVYCVITDANGESLTTDTVSIYVKKPLEIIRQPENVYADALGERVTISVEAEGSGLTYQWFYKNKGASKFLASSTKESEYTTALTAKTDGRQVYCEITDAAGNTVTSEVAEMWLYTPLEITQQPIDTEVQALGDRAEVSVEAEGTGLVYQWYYKNKGASKFLASSAKTATYVTAVTAKVNERQVYCEITDVKGNMVRTDTVTLSVAKEINIDDVIYEVVDNVMTVTGYVGSAASVTVQGEVAGKTVTVIGAGAFEGKDFIESVDLPDSIEIIKERAFKGCTSLSKMD